MIAGSFVVDCDCATTAAGDADADADARRGPLLPSAPIAVTDPARFTRSATAGEESKGRSLAIAGKCSASSSPAMRPPCAMTWSAAADGRRVPVVGDVNGGDSGGESEGRAGDGGVLSLFRASAAATMARTFATCPQGGRGGGSGCG